LYRHPGFASDASGSSSLQAAVEEEQRRKEAEAATQRKKQPQWAGNKAELFKTIRQRLVAQVG